MPTRKDNEKHDQTVEDSFPASDPPATSGVVGPRVARRGTAPHERDGEARPKGTPTQERHATETAYQREAESKPNKPQQR
jgi:hypothetical protein